MPCGSASAAARAVQHLWITDDLLAQAFHRFARVSNTHRRHGSSVPGPMEARRRQAKRRMGMETIASNYMPHSDLGSLFGLGRATPPPDFEKGWKWEAPRRDTAIRRDQAPDTTFDDFLSVPADPVEVSRTAFDALLNALENNRPMRDLDLRPLTDFLDSVANERDSQLTLRLVQRLVKWTKIPNESLNPLIKSIRRRIQNETISPDEITSIIMCLLYDSTIRHSWVRRLVRLANLPHVVFPTLTERILEASPDRTERIAKLSGWLNRIDPCKYTGKPDDPWTQVYQMLAQHFTPLDFPVHFGRVHRRTFALAVLQHWAPAYALRTAGTEVSRSDPRSTLEDSILHTAMVIPSRGYKRYRFARNTSILDWQSVQRKFDERDARNDSYVLNTLTRTMHKLGVPYDRVQREIFTVLLATQPPSLIKNYVLDITHSKKGGEVGISTKLGTELVRHFLDAGHTKYAVSAFLGIPTIPLRECYDLPIKLIEEGQTSGNIIWQIMLRSTVEDKVASMDRNPRGNRLRPEHVKMIHQAAYAWAFSPYLNARTALRRVWACYRLLSASTAPVSPLISRAMVKAGIARSIKENGRLSQEQARYVIGLVDKVEGPEVAAALDRLVFVYWTRVKAMHGYEPGTQQNQTPYPKDLRMIWRNGVLMRSLRLGGSDEDGKQTTVSAPAVATAARTHEDSMPNDTEDGAVAEMSEFLQEHGNDLAKKP